MWEKQKVFNNKFIAQELTRSNHFNAIEEWKDVACFFAYVTFDSTEVEQQGVTRLATTAKIRTHFRSDLNHKQRLKLGDKIFNITSIVNENNANRILEITAKEVI